MWLLLLLSNLFQQLHFDFGAQIRWTNLGFERFSLTIFWRQEIQCKI
jgi:hypothetical protein